MAGHSENTQKASYDLTRSDLRMAPEAMLDLARKAAELLVERIQNLPGENAWDGEFRQGLEDQLLKEPPEAGRPAAEVIEQFGTEART